MIEHIIEISETAVHLRLRNSLAVFVSSNGEERTCPLDEIGCLLVSNPAVSITGALLAALAEHGCMVVVSNEKYIPVAMHLPINGNCIQTERFRAQINVDKPLNKQLWKSIVKAKICGQARFLQELEKKESEQLFKMSEKVKSGDVENIEGQAARIYWKALFGPDFIRNREADDANVLLNYGYAILRSMAARACCASGLHPTLGINHHNKYDAYCLADDIMEPFRSFVDKAVYELNPLNISMPLGRNVRKKLLEVLLAKVPSKKKNCVLSDLVISVAQQVMQSYLTGQNCLAFD